ncbi:MAG: OmpA family protein [Burkholderiaceae bacterium]|nr:OmpA family protein [Burkholderiaceae bacterium]
MKQLPAKTLILSLLLTACSSVQQANPGLEDARAAYSAAQSNPQIAALAPAEMQQAGEALNAADLAWQHKEKPDKVDQLAHIAKEKVVIAQETAQRKQAENVIASAAKERDRVQLEERTAEADRAKARAEQLQIQLKELEAKKTDHGMVVTLNDLLFNVNKAELNPGGTRTVQKVADILKQNPERHVLIEGFTDSTGSVSYNQQLSERRANAVRLALIDMGVGPERIVARGNGPEFPVATNSTAAGRQMNRRVEIVFPEENNSSPSVSKS